MTKEATCTEKGVKTYTCKNCGETKTEEIPALGHSFGEWTITKYATCKETGLMTRKCTTMTAVQKLRQKNSETGKPFMG